MEAQEGIITCICVSTSIFGTMTVILNKLLWEAYTGDWKEIK